MTPLRQRMLEDMQLRGLAARTQVAYVGAVELRAERWTEIRQLAREYSLEEQRAPGILTV
jgi:hypothetical protein